MAEARRPALDISTAPDDREFININQAPYFIRSTRDLELDDFQYLEPATIRVARLLKMGAHRSKNETKELAALLRRVVALAVDAPAEILEKLDDIQRVSIFKVFTELLLPGILSAVRALEPAAPVPGTKQSPGSSVSTAGAMRSGSGKRRSGSSKRH